MNRRNFIRVIGSSGLSLTLPAVLTACTHPPVKQQTFWLQKPTQHEDIRLRLLAYAMLAPNAHNKQPWLIKLEDKQRFLLYVDQTRLLPETDPYARQIHISQGCFIEHLELAARQFAFRLEIDYFPAGMYANNLTENKPVAAFQLHQDHSVKPDPLFAYAIARHSNKRIYDDKVIESSTLNELKLMPLLGKSQLQLSNTQQDLQTLPDMLARAMAIEVSAHRRHMETVNMFRFNDEEIKQHRDGFGLAQTGRSGISKWLIESLFISRAQASQPGSAFAQQSVDLTRLQAESARAFGSLSSRGNERMEQLLVGRNYARLNLYTQRMGLAIHPMSQILEEYEDMTGLRNEFYRYLKIPRGETVQMLFRLGYAKPVTHTPRRNPVDLFI